MISREEQAYADSLSADRRDKYIKEKQELDTQIGIYNIWRAKADIDGKKLYMVDGVLCTPTIYTPLCGGSIVVGYQPVNGGSHIVNWTLVTPFEEVDE